MGAPPAGLTVRSPVSKARPPVPLLGAAGCGAAPNRPRMRARTAAIPHQHDVRGRPRVAWPHVRPRPVGVRRNRHNDRERPGQSRPKNVHIGFSCHATGSRARSITVYRDLSSPQPNRGGHPMVAALPDDPWQEDAGAGSTGRAPVGDGASNE